MIHADSALILYLRNLRRPNFMPVQYCIVHFCRRPFGWRHTPNCILKFTRYSSMTSCIHLYIASNVIIFTNLHQERNICFNSSDFLVRTANRHVPLQSFQLNRFTHSQNNCGTLRPLNIGDKDLAYMFGQKFRPKCSDSVRHWIRMAGSAWIKF